MSSFNGPIEADLHGLVDGQIEPSRRASALRRLAASPSDRARVEGWQAQNDMLRNAFTGVEREAVPAMLDLRARPQLHCIPANDPPLVAPISARPAPRRSRLAAAGAIAIIAGGLVGSWVLLNQSDTDDAPTSTAAATLRSPIDTDVARRTSAAVGAGTPSRSSGVEDLPTSRIPDLRMAGFRFTGAETVTAKPPAVLFRYKNANAERLVVSVTRAADAATSSPERIGRAVSWQTGDKIFVLAGTPDTTRLRTIATALHQTTQ